MSTLAKTSKKKPAGDSKKLTKNDNKNKEYQYNIVKSHIIRIYNNIR